MRGHATVLELRLQDDGRVTVDMGAPVFEPARVPFDTHALAARREGDAELWPLVLPNGPTVEVAVVSMGNPHAVQRVADGDLSTVVPLRAGDDSSVMATVAQGVGMPLGIVAGQAWECEPRVALQDYQRAKTGALFAAATMAGADLLVLFSDIDGLYTAPPARDPAARHIPLVERITPEIDAMAGGAASELSRGGMRTKIEAGKIAASGGTHMLIADGRAKNPLAAIAAGARCTWFLTASTPATARKTWIAGSLEPRGTLHVDAGAARALAGGASLLPVGVSRIEGDFARGDAVLIRDPEGRLLGRGLVAYDAGEAALVLGKASRDIGAILGYPGRAEMIHRDDMALGVV